MHEPSAKEAWEFCEQSMTEFYEERLKEKDEENLENQRKLKSIHLDYVKDLNDKITKKDHEINRLLERIEFKDALIFSYEKMLTDK